MPKHPLRSSPLPERLSPHGLRPGIPGAHPTPSPVESTAPTGRRPDARDAVDWLTVAAVTAVVIVGLHPSALVADALPWQGDHAGQAMLVRWVEDAHSLRGWSDWESAGFPVHLLCPALTTLLSVLADQVLPLAVGYKLVSVLGLLTLPTAGYLAARWSGSGRPAARVVAVATLLVVFDTASDAVGGNLPSTLAGLTAPSLGSALGLAAVGAVDRLWRTGTGAVRAGALVGLALLCHPTSALWVVTGVVATAAIRRPWRPRRRLVTPVTALGAAVLLALWWWLPLLSLSDWIPDLGDPGPGAGAAAVFPSAAAWEVTVTALAAFAVVWSVRRREWFAVTVAAPAVLCAALFPLVGGNQLLGTQVLSGWFLGRWLLFGLGVLALGELAVTRGAPPWAGLWVRASSAVLLAVVTTATASSWGWLLVDRPARDGADGRSRIPGIAVTRYSDLVSETWRGWESRPEYPELVAVRGMLRRTAATSGCGRLAWDQVEASDPGGASAPFGGDRVLVESAVWTSGCIRALSGVHAGSSMTTTDIQYTSQLSSLHAYRRVRDATPAPYSLPTGIARLQGSGVRYYLTHGGQVEADAAANPRLRRVGATGRFALWEIVDWSYVEPLTSSPRVAQPPVTDPEWQRFSAIVQAEYRGQLLIAQSGPPGWLTTTDQRDPPTLPTAKVSAVTLEDGQLSFTVDRTGVPMLVKVSAFPGWSASGAAGPYRVTPNFMVVVPTAPHVTLQREATAAERCATGCLVLGLLTLLLLGVAPTSRVSRYLLSRISPVAPG